jgi:hypothetical protein
VIISAFWRDRAAGIPLCRYWHRKDVLISFGADTPERLQRLIAAYEAERLDLVRWLHLSDPEQTHYARLVYDEVTL